MNLNTVFSLLIQLTRQIKGMLHCKLEKMFFFDTNQKQKFKSIKRCEKMYA